MFARGIIPACLALAMASASTSEATTIVILQKGESLFVGADSRRNINLGAATEDVCKVRIEGGLIVLISGLVAATDVTGREIYSAESSVRLARLLWSGSVENVADDIARTFELDLPTGHGIQLAVIGMEGARPRVALREVTRTTFDTQRRAPRFDGLAILGQSVAFRGSRIQDTLQVLAMPGSEVIQWLIRAEIANSPQLVNHPINSLEIRPDGEVKWIERSSLCAVGPPNLARPPERRQLVAAAPERELELPDLSTLLGSLPRIDESVTALLAAPDDRSPLSLIGTERELELPDLSALLEPSPTISESLAALLAAPDVSPLSAIAPERETGLPDLSTLLGSLPRIDESVTALLAVPDNLSALSLIAPAREPGFIDVSALLGPAPEIDESLAAALLAMPTDLLDLSDRNGLLPKPVSIDETLASLLDRSALIQPPSDSAATDLERLLLGKAVSGPDGAAGASGVSHPARAADRQTR